MSLTITSAFFSHATWLSRLLICVPSIISVSTYTAILSSVASPLDKIYETPHEFHVRGTWLWTFIKLFGFLGLVAGVLYAYKTYVLRSASGKGFGMNFGRPGVGGGFYNQHAKRF